MVYTRPIYHREDINRAATQLASEDGTGPFDLDQAFSIVNNWRSSHAFPLNCFHVTLRARSKKIDSSALTAQRLKRLPSITAKLARFPEMKLTQMQDLGGCRAVVKDIATVERLVATYKKARAKNPQSRHEFVHEKDYVNTPKPDGYRSHHLIYRYRSRAKKHKAYNGLKIEIQIRTKLQHAWATAVEIISTFTGQALKSNIGDESWKRFFKLVSTYIALQEKTTPVDGTPTDPKELVGEIKKLSEQLNVPATLAGWGYGVNIITERSAGAHTFLLVLNSNERRIRVKQFAIDEWPKAQQEYIDVEKKDKDKPWIQAVLVSVDSIAALRRAYPNYYLDSESFSNAVARAITEAEGHEARVKPGARK